MNEPPLIPADLAVRTLGEPRFPSPLDLPAVSPEATGSFVPEGTGVRYRVEVDPGGDPPGEPLLFEKSGSRARIFFDPAETTAAIVTCGGLCPGTNTVIRSLFYELHHRYRVRRVLGVRYGFRGLTPQGEPPVDMDPSYVRRIQVFGGTVLGSSRGHQDPAVMVDTLAERGVSVLFAIGGDGTQRGAHAISEEARRRGLPLAVVGIPKTIDNDIPFVYRSFGFFTALDKAREVIQGAHTEAIGVPHGVGLVKLMGRHAGFIAAGAALASQEVNFVLIPEVPFALEGENGFLAVLERRLDERGHAVVVAAEGAGQDLFEDRAGRDVSGNVKLHDVGQLLRERIEEHFTRRRKEVHVKYFDPSYLVRSVPATSEDRLHCDALARHAAHAGMAGKTDVMIGFWHHVYVYVPIPAVNARKKRLAPEGGVWQAVLEATGQPRKFG
jgi:6-phosphofructokinase 1